MRIPSSSSSGSRTTSSVEYGINTTLLGGPLSEPFTNQRPEGLSDPAPLKAFVATGRQLYSALYQDLNARIRACEQDIKKYEREANERHEGNGALVDMRAQIANENLTVTAAELVRLKELRETLKPKINDDSLLRMLLNLGPASDLKTKNSVGVLGQCRVLGIMNEQALFVAVGQNRAWALLWVDSTKGYDAGQYTHVGPVMLTGFETTVLPAGTQTNVTRFAVLVAMDPESVRQQVFGGSTAASAAPAEPLDGFRTWTDTSGKFSIEAILVNVDGENVQLRRRDGVAVTVQKSKLSDADRRALDDRK
jgi:hypothetical protein